MIAVGWIDTEATEAVWDAADARGGRRRGIRRVASPEPQPETMLRYVYTEVRFVKRMSFGQATVDATAGRCARTTR